MAAALPEMDKGGVQAAIARCGLPEGVRGEKLTLEDFAALSAALREKMR